MPLTPVLWSRVATKDLDRLMHTCVTAAMRVMTRCSSSSDTACCVARCSLEAATSALRAAKSETRALRLISPISVSSVCPAWTIF